MGTEWPHTVGTADRIPTYTAKPTATRWPYSAECVAFSPLPRHINLRGTLVTLKLQPPFSP